jgi:hypothetical protein
MLARRSALAFGVGHELTALLLIVGVFMGLPARWMPVDTVAGLLVVLHVGAGALLIQGHGRAKDVARIASMASLGVGLLFIAILAWTASYLSGIYGPVGRGGAIIMVLVIALALPYLVALPAGELLWLGPRKAPASPAPKPVAETKESAIPSDAA